MLSNKVLFSDKLGNEIRFSSVTHTEQEVKFQNFSVKYVVSGIENYNLNNRKLITKKGEYVVGNKTTEANVIIDSKTTVNGICIDVSKEIITEVLDFKFPNPTPLYNFLFNEDILIQKYNVLNTCLGDLLSKLGNDFYDIKDNYKSINTDFFYSIAECIVEDQNYTHQNFKRIKSAKQETSKHLFNLTNEAKNYIDDNFLEKINIDKMAKEAKLSEYHFIRLFKTIFGTTPYKYLTQKRLNYSLELLKNQISVSDITHIIGYTDTPAFSNAFKQKFGVSPNNFK
ncbi:helix-turn-helix domain-containing protein [Flavobacterium dankookense]|uniref:AraC-like DNA-binding protein n=1 Tax=Flavobacterium dankookense TaxID=706186 RepID=A0A4R6QFK3_9FLAO|nr:AraC family transcriptional regulator [Flavobacterium dankookense]TDP61160.1 AraC-like DNA-binding protein [Flavobacterium dankookense]